MTFSSLLSIRSHPVRVRGLKQFEGKWYRPEDLSHPVRVRGLKHIKIFFDVTFVLSHPVRVRGLKHS